jgi:hypothetical protein
MAPWKRLTAPTEQRGIAAEAVRQRNGYLAQKWLDLGDATTIES